MNAAHLDFTPDDLSPGPVSDPDPHPTFALKQQVAEKVRAHRARRTPASAPDAISLEPSGPQPSTAHPAPHSRSAHIAAAVAERYAQSQTYRAFLAAEAERSVRSAQATADIALINAQAIAGAQRQMLEDLDTWPNSTHTPPPTSPSAYIEPPSATSGRPSALDLAAFPNFPDNFDHHDSPDFPNFPDRSDLTNRAEFAPAQEQLRPSDFTVRMYEAVDRPRSEAAFRARKSDEAFAPEDEVDEAERLALDDEIAFRQSPTFDEQSGAPVPLAANLIEFPRHLVATRKARPRLAEGPLRESSDPTETAQLRIFEVEANQISAAPANESVTPEWTSILLPAQPADATAELGELDFSPALVPQTATLSRRMLSTAIDGGIVLAASVLFGAVAFTAATHIAGPVSLSPETLSPGIFSPATLSLESLNSGTLSPATLPKLLLPFAIAAASIFAALTILYQILFFTLSDSTPGMRCARIALCTFGDENPTRQAMRRRVWAILLSGLPLGIGFLWAWLDDAGLSWHDRISRMYQRSY